MLTRAPAAAQEAAQAPTPVAGVRLHGFVDVYATWNPNRPFDHNNFEPGTGTTGEKANEVGLNLAAVDVSLDPSPVGFHLVAVAGTGTDVVHASELHPDAVRYVYQASVSWRLNVGRGLLLEAGIQPSHIGFESFYSKENWNYTRGWLGEFSPYYQTGIKAATSFDDRWSGQLWLLNGWQSVEDNNSGKSFGTQLSYAADALGLTLNTFFGPEIPNDSSHWRSFVDLVGTWRVSSTVSAAACIDLGRQTRPGQPPADWQGASLWARFATGRTTAIAARAELFHDPDKGISGFAQTLWGGTITLEYRPHPRLVLKLEARYDRSTAGAFSGPDVADPRRDETLLALGAVATF